MAVKTVSDSGGNWNSTSTWTDNIVPVNGDEVVFTPTSGNLVVNVSTANLIGINFTNYVGTITFDNNINVRTTINLGTGGYVQAGSFGLNLYDSVTGFTSNSVVWSRRLTFTGVNAQTYTLLDNLFVMGDIIFSVGTAHVLNGFNLYIGGNLTLTSSGTIQGTTNFIINGNTTWSSAGSQIRNNLEINTTGSTTIFGTVYYSGNRLKYVTANTITTSGSTLSVGNIGGTILETSGMTWDNVRFDGGSPTLSSDLNMVGNLTTGLSAVQILGNFNLNVGGNLTLGNQIYGTATIVLNGVGNQTWSGNFALRLSMTINKPSGNFIVSGSVIFQGNPSGILNYVNADNAITTGSTLNLLTTTTLNTSGITWNNVTMGVSTTQSNVTLDSDLYMSGNLLTQGTQVKTINGVGRTVYVGGNLTVNSTTSGTANIILNGSSNQTWSATSYLSNNLTIDKTGGFIVSSNVYYNTNTLNYITASTTVVTGSTLNINTSCTLNTSGMSWNNLTVDGTSTINLSSDLNVDGTLTTQTNSVVFSGSGRTINSRGNLTINSSTSGNANIILNGTGNQTWVGTAALSNNLTIDKTGTFILGTTAYYNTGVLTYNTASTVVTSGGTLLINGTCSLETSGVTWTNLKVWNTTTLNLLSDLNMTNWYINRIEEIGLDNPNAYGKNANVSISGSSQLNVDTLYIGYANFSLLTAVQYTSQLNLPYPLTVNNLNVRLSGSRNPQGSQYVNHNSIINNHSLTILNSLVLNSFGGVDTSGREFALNPVFLGTSELIVSGPTWTNYSSNMRFYYQIPITIDTTNLTITTNNVGTASNGVPYTDNSLYFSTLTFKHLSGNVTSNFNFVFRNSTLDLNNVSLSGGSCVLTGTVSLLSDTTFINTTTTTGFCSKTAGVSTTTFSGSYNFNVIGNLTIGAPTSGPNTPIIINGTSGQTWTATAYLSNNLIINKPSDTLTIGTNVYYQTGTLTYTSGLVDTTTNSSTLNLASSPTLVTNGIIWYNISHNSNGTTTLTNDFSWSNNWLINNAHTITFSGLGNLSPQPTANLIFAGSPSVTLKNNIQINNASLGIATINTNQISLSGNLSVTGSVGGTTNILFNGSGAQSWSHPSASYISNNITINKPGGTLTLGSNIYYNTRTLTRTAGNVNTTTNNTTLNINASCTLATQGITWNAINWVGGTITLSNPLTAIGVITVTHSFPIINGSDLYANGGMNYTALNLSTNFAYMSGNATIRFEGTGSWNSSQQGTYQNNVIINPTGNFSINVYYALGTITYDSTNGGNVTSAYVTLGYYTALSGRGLTRSTTFNTNTMRWDYILCMSYTDSGGGTTSNITCLSNLNVNYMGFTGIGVVAGDVWNFVMSTDANLVNVGNFNLDARCTVNLAKDFTTKTLSFSTGIFQRLNNGVVTITDLLTSSSSQGAINITGSAKLILGDNCSWQRGDNNTALYFNMEFKGSVKFGTPSFPIMYFYNNSIEYTGYNSKPSKASGTLYIASNATLTNFNRLSFSNLIIGAGLTLTMNEFFSGYNDFRCNVSSSSTASNFNVNLTMSNEKIVKYLNISNCTLNSNGQVLVVTDNRKSITNRGLRYINNLANSLPKNDSKIINNQFYSISEKPFITDPCFISKV